MNTLEKITEYLKELEDEYGEHVTFELFSDGSANIVSESAFDYKRFTIETISTPGQLQAILERSEK